ncbi:cold-regulated protein 28-like [Ipomoea triloba]|uniref:cold-regulated protein 28-like n=1 Tax=Ipomoea triloba TaxID=35885 RepID=UPI00125D617D|nr:cold-regulated protein 28-like [Ipomoea triloba]
MEESHRTAPPPGCGIPASSPSCTDEFTGSTADASFLTAENFRDALHHTANAKLGDCTRWTNEKHNLYLDILEASFVKQLYQSTLLSRCSEQNKNNRNVVKELPAKMDRVFEQFPALQASCNKNNIERDQPALYTATPSSHAQQLYEADLHKCHKLHSEKKCLQEKRKFPCGLAKRSELHTDLQNSVCSMTEGSGQNFVDGCEENTDRKRRKAATGDISSHEVHDQIVPCGKFDSPTIASST